MLAKDRGAMRVATRMKLGLLFSSAVLLAACAGNSGDGESTGSTDDALTTVCGASTTGPTQGYDVSTYQGAFDWSTHKVAFGAARISDGLGSIDARFDGNWSGMKTNGVLRGAYQFFEPGEDEVAQANLVISKVGKLGEGDLPVMLDVEVTGGQSPATIQTKAKHWLELVEAGTGKRPFVYSYASFLQTNLGSGFGKYPLWIAGYGESCPSVPSGWTNWAFWQYSDGNGALDHDVFNGSLATLKDTYAGPLEIDAGPSAADAGEKSDAAVVAPHPAVDAGETSPPPALAPLAPDGSGDDGGGCTMTPASNSRSHDSAFFFVAMIGLALSKLRRRR
jgi:lysozyme